ncbi:MAG: cytochrome c [Actinobacteria bacterium]|nr:cytochrome c [Actinomycetota bacterium]
MFKRIVRAVEVVALLLAGVFVVLLFANEPGSKEGDPGAAASPGQTLPVIVDPAALFAQHCSGCHGDEGQGGFGPRLAGGAVKTSYPNEADQVKFVTDGFGPMPAFGERLSEAEIEAVVAYTREEL